MENEGWKTVTMKIAVWQKDMKLIAAALKDAGVPAPLFAATVPLYDAAMGMGHGLHDTQTAKQSLGASGRSILGIFCSVFLHIQPFTV